MSANFALALLKFSSWLQSSETHPSICSCFMATLSSHQVMLFYPSADPTTIVAAQEQDHIGWENFLLGQVSLQWSTIQESYLHAQHSCQSIKAWETALVKQLLAISHAMWTCHNGILHHRMESAARLLEAETLRNQIHSQFSLGLQDLLLSDHELMTHCSLAQVLHYPIPAQQQWLSAIDFAHSHGLQQRNSELQQMWNSMTAFLNGPTTLP